MSVNRQRSRRGRVAEDRVAGAGVGDVTDFGADADAQVQQLRNVLSPLREALSSPPSLETVDWVDMLLTEAVNPHDELQRLTEVCVQNGQFEKLEDIAMVMSEYTDLQARAQEWKALALEGIERLPPTTSRGATQSEARRQRGQEDESRNSATHRLQEEEKRAEQGRRQDSQRRRQEGQMNAAKLREEEEMNAEAKRTQQESVLAESRRAQEERRKNQEDDVRVNAEIMRRHEERRKKEEEELRRFREKEDEKRAREAQERLKIASQNLEAALSSGLLSSAFMRAAVQQARDAGLPQDQLAAAERAIAEKEGEERRNIEKQENLRQATEALKEACISGDPDRLKRALDDARSAEVPEVECKKAAGALTLLRVFWTERSTSRGKGPIFNAWVAVVSDRKETYQELAKALSTGAGAEDLQKCLGAAEDAWIPGAQQSRADEIDKLSFQTWRDVVVSRCRAHDQAVCALVSKSLQQLKLAKAANEAAGGPKVDVPLLDAAIKEATEVDQMLQRLNSTLPTSIDDFFKDLELKERREKEQHALHSQVQASERALTLEYSQNCTQPKDISLPAPLNSKQILAKQSAAGERSQPLPLSDAWTQTYATMKSQVDRVREWFTSEEKKACQSFLQIRSPQQILPSQQANLEQVPRPIEYPLSPPLPQGHHTTQDFYPASNAPLARPPVTNPMMPPSYTAVTPTAFGYPWANAGEHQLWRGSERQLLQSAPGVPWPQNVCGPSGHQLTPGFGAESHPLPNGQGYVPQEHPAAVGWMPPPHSHLGSEVLQRRFYENENFWS